MLLIITAFALSLTPADEQTGVVIDDCATLEVQHVYDSLGREILLQLIVWEKSDSGQRVQTWRLWSGGLRPTRNFSTGEYELIWHDGETTRKLCAKKFVETHGQTDREIDDREVYPKDRRRPLTTPCQNAE